jgi:hypothetical protein
VSLARTNITPQLFLTDIVKCQPVLNAVRAVIGGRQTFQMVCMAIALSRLRTYLQKTELVERYCRTIGCGLVYIPAD